MMTIMDVDVITIDIITIVINNKGRLAIEPFSKKIVLLGMLAILGVSDPVSADTPAACNAENKRCNQACASEQSEDDRSFCQEECALTYKDCLKDELPASSIPNSEVFKSVIDNIVKAAPESEGDNENEE